MLPLSRASKKSSKLDLWASLPGSGLQHACKWSKSLSNNMLKEINLKDYCNVVLWAWCEFLPISTDAKMLILLTVLHRFLMEQVRSV